MLNYSYIFLLFPFIVSLIWFFTFIFSKISLRNPRFIMALFMACGSITFLSGIGMYGGALHIYKIVYPFVFFTALALFPLFYIYVLQIVTPSKIRKQLFIHFVPAGILLCCSVILYALLMSPEEKLYYINQFLLNKTSVADEVYRKFSLMKFVDTTAKLSYILLSIVYYIATVRLVNKHQKTIEDYYSSLKAVSLDWVKTLGIFFVLAVISGIAVHWFHRRDILDNDMLSSIPFLFLGIFFAMIGNHSNRQSVNIFPSKNLESDESEDTSVLKSLPEENTNDGEDENSGTIPDGLKDKLEIYFSEKRPYLNPELKIWDVARHLNTNRTYISRLINQAHGVRFSVFVNRYRIQEAKEMMTHPKTGQYSLSVIAGMSGFVNYSSFVRAFRQFEGIAPNEFRQRNTAFNQ
ncbi:Helix-turn-helix domain-containing protein [Saccharicrinis carchari]|uniref:Helix-turn-helix domain-containing protein n=1 Tax=Saccharicrinis carchari TaxID=1168039 RepID=A0A521D651_SACCC|nr:helix-turn-helix domain-containing protein [Saccharicrinis carchari]SMO67147.1 Helix-turn-helix domain-containing protein [Saccharicrinis carchari]